jgi:hypothetical protein
MKVCVLVRERVCESVCILPWMSACCFGDVLLHVHCIHMHVLLLVWANVSICKCTLYITRFLFISASYGTRTLHTTRTQVFSCVLSVHART